MKYQKQSGFIVPLVIVIVAVVAIGGGTYAYKKTKVKTAAEADATTVVETGVQSEGDATSTISATTSAQVGVHVSGKKSFKELAQSTTPQKCTFREAGSGSNTDGVVYVSSGKVRGDFNSTVSGSKVVSHMITDGSDVYAWVDGVAMGIKTSINAETSTQSPETDVNRKVDVTCVPWTANNSMFTPPRNIEFTSITGAVAR